MNKVKNSPEIRFSVFDVEWCVCKMIDVAPLQRGFDLPKSQLKSGIYPVVMSNGVLENHSECKAKAPGVVTGRSGTIGRVHYIEQDYWPHNTSLWVTDFKNNLPLYIYYAYIRLDLKLLATGSGVPTLNRNDVHDQITFVPTFSEQQKIGTYFKQIDKLITLKQKKHTKLVNLKKAMLNKMFPQNGAITPEIRFKGFDGEWEERRLGDIVSKAVDNRGKTPPIVVNSKYPLIEVASLGKGKPDYSKVIKFVDEPTYNNWFRAHIKENDLLFSTVGNTGLVSLMDNSKSAVIAQNIIAFRASEKYIPSYLLAMFQLEENLNKAKRIEMGAVQPSIKVSQLIELSYTVANNKDEQKKIGQFSSKIEELIELQKREINSLKNIKKALLEKMFV